MQQNEFIPATYQIKFVYKDGKDLNVNVEANYLQQFFEELSNKKIYWNETKTQGFWTNLDEVRFVQVSLLAQPLPQLPAGGRIEKISGQDTASNRELPSDIEQPASGKKVPMGA